MSTMRNSVMLIGRTTKPIMDTERGQATFKITIEEPGHGCSTAITFDCVARAERAQRVVRDIKQGQRVAIDGSLRNHDYTDRLGDTHTHTEIEIYDIFPIERNP